MQQSELYVLKKCVVFEGQWLYLPGVTQRPSANPSGIIKKRNLLLSASLFLQPDHEVLCVAGAAAGAGVRARPCRATGGG